MKSACFFHTLPFFSTFVQNLTQQRQQLLKRSSPVLEINFGSLPTESINLKNHIKFYIYDAFWVPHLFGPPKIPLGPRPWAQRALISMTRRSSTIVFLRSNLRDEKTTFNFQAIVQISKLPTRTGDSLGTITIMNIKTHGILENCFISCKLFTQKW